MANELSLEYQALTLAQVDALYRARQMSEADYDHYLVHWRNTNTRYPHFFASYSAQWLEFPRCLICAMQFPTLERVFINDQPPEDMHVDFERVDLGIPKEYQQQVEPGLNP